MIILACATALLERLERTDFSTGIMSRNDLFKLADVAGLASNMAAVSIVSWWDSSALVSS